MSADLLRRAAAKLREMAEAATPGPWVHVDHGPRSATSEATFMGCGQVITEGAEVFGGDIAGPTGDLYPRGGYSPLDDMAFIALMHPPVALALASWLAAVSEEHAIGGVLGGFLPRSHTFALVLARAVLREEES